MKRLLLMAIVFGLLISGCAQDIGYWYRANTSMETLYSDYMICRGRWYKALDRPVFIPGDSENSCMESKGYNWISK